MSRVSTKRARVVTADQWGVPERNEAGEPVCRWCKGPVIRPRRTFCSDPCVHEWKIRSSPWYVRREVKKRDKGICKLCGFNVVKAHREWTRSKPPASDRAARKVWRAARPKGEADHIVPVADGGGDCGLANVRTVRHCRACRDTDHHSRLCPGARQPGTRRRSAPTDCGAHQEPEEDRRILPALLGRERRQALYRDPEA